MYTIIGDPQAEEDCDVVQTQVAAKILRENSGFQSLWRLPIPYSEPCLGHQKILHDELSEYEGVQGKY